MINAFIKSVLKKSTLRENRLLIIISLILTILMAITLYRVYGVTLLSWVEFLRLTSINVITMFVMALSIFLIVPLKSFAFNSRVLQFHSSRELFRVQSKKDRGLGNLVVDQNIYQENIANENIFERGSASKAMSTDETKLSILSEFIASSANIYNPKEFILLFLDSIERVVDVEAAGYMLELEEGFFENNIIASNPLNRIELESLKGLFIKSVSNHINNLAERCSREVEFIQRGQIKPSTLRKSINTDKLSSIKFPLKSFGTPVGAFIIFFDTDKTENFDFSLIEPTVDYARISLERLITTNSKRESLLETVLSSMNEGIFLIDKNGLLKILNNKAQDIISLACNFKRECLEQGMGLGECPHKLLNTCEMGWLVRELREDAPSFVDGRYVREIHTEDNRDFLFIVTEVKEGVEKGGYIISASDITDDKAMRKELFLSSKLAALGEMAAGIAHEVNNPLQIMMGNVDILEEWLKEDELGSKKVKDIREGIFKIKSVVSNMLIFARDESMAIENADLNSVIAGAIDIVRGQLNLSDISVECDLQESLFPVKCNKNLLQQVLINIIQNAKDSIDEFGKGSLIHIHSNAYCDDKAVIVITDDGHGIPEELLDRIFDPFFTTKDIGKGTGLGLSISRRIIESMGGDIKVSSIEGVSASFYITLERGLENDSSHIESPAKDIDISVLINKKILMVEDEARIVDVVKPILSPMVSVLDTFTCANDAYAMLKDNEYDIIFLDIGMFDEASMELFDWIKVHTPHLAENIIFLTSDIKSEKIRGLCSLTGIPAIEKPFAVNDLLSVMISKIEEKEVGK